MGYDLRITRRRFPWDFFDLARGCAYVPDGEITRREWIDHFLADPEFSYEGDPAELTSFDGLPPDAPLRNWVFWKAHLIDNVHPPFCWRAGDIAVKNPDETIIAKMHAVATALGARVQGDEGEFYNADASTYWLQDTE